MMLTMTIQPKKASSQVKKTYHLLRSCPLPPAEMSSVQEEKKRRYKNEMTDIYKRKP